ncbi:carbohydrate ABC transporter permease [Flavisolibacter ginsengisoli]|jgi:ABC-type glycerol-3-phosphate transport system permease component|uniref:Multiple sugar transport system permease protein n=1 Tax=Flavisolibacter ginsengisoli DSM 18119 TaxID=1121884 RepID=A0A1M4UEA6_9BACT|nr:carbohydrate ABC transporter permease [Flavisolibacter ginsengisoli]SHE55151.1 multiple sugar transport system permease protein [Flavisolibacter ginsengisoli DSM 18119]
MNGSFNIKRIITYAALSLAALTFIYPFIWMIGASLAPLHEVGNMKFWPAHPTINNFQLMIGKIPIGRSLFNSLLVALLTTSLVLLTGSTVGYALAKLQFRGRQLIFYIIVFTMSLPFQITLIPNYITMVNLRLVDTYMALVVPFAVSAFAILMFRQAFQGLPQALIDAARLDGCSELGLIFRILWPNIKPTIITVAILTFIGSWNEVLWPLIVIRNEQLMTMPQLVTLFAVGGRADSQLGVKIAAAVLLALPVMIAFLFFQKHFIQSMASTGLKD